MSNYQAKYGLSDADLAVIDGNVKKANKILQSIDIKKTVKENHQCEKIKQYLATL